MNQEITISPCVIAYLSTNLPAFEINNAQKVIEKLKENHFTVDKNREHFKILWMESKKIKNEIVMRYIQKLLEHWFTQKMSIIPIEFDSVEGLAIESDDKILFLPNKTSKQIDKIKIKNVGLDIYNENSFISPETYNKLKHSETKLIFEREVVYNLAEILTPYLRNTKTITIEDPYLPNTNAMDNLKSLLNIFMGSEIVLKTHTKHNYSKSKNDGKANFKDLEMLINQMVKEWKKVTHIFYSKKQHQERFIITDSVTITLPGGLDFIDKFGVISNNDAKFVEVEVSKLQ